MADREDKKGGKGGHNMWPPYFYDLYKDGNSSRDYGAYMADNRILRDIF